MLIQFATAFANSQTRMRVLHVVAETPQSFLQHLKDITFIERRPLKWVTSRLSVAVRTRKRLTYCCTNFRFCAERLTSLVRTLELTQIDEYHSLQKLAQFATLVATYEKGGNKQFGRRVPNIWLIGLLSTLGFLLILEPYETEAATVPNPIFHFT